jgi:hypothetical protein
MDEEDFDLDDLRENTVDIFEEDEDDERTMAAFLNSNYDF